MADLVETAAWAAAVHKLAITDPVQGGDETAVANLQAKALADRTAYLKASLETLATAVADIEVALATPLTTPAAGSDGAAAATTAFVHRAQGGADSVDCAGGANVTLTSDQWGHAVIILTGLLTGSINVIFPTREDYWHVLNRTTGAYEITCKTAAGTGVKVAQGRGKGIIGDGTNIVDAETDIATRPLTKTATYTLANGQLFYVDQSGGAFSGNLPASPAEGDRCGIMGNFLAANHTVSRNGQQIRDAAGVAQSADYVADRNGLSAWFTFVGGAWQVTVG